MTKSHKRAREDVDIPTLGRALWHAKGWIVGLALGAGLVTFVALSMMRPLYTSEARILIQNEESAFTRPAEDSNRNPQQQTLDEQAVQSQVQVLTSRDLALDVIRTLDLTNNPDFAKDEGLSLFRRILNRIGLRESPKSEEERAANTFAENLEVFQLAKSSVIAVDYTSGDSSLAAKIANQLADSYIEWQRKEKLDQTKDATAWLRDQIEVLRKKVEESEAAAEQFRSSQGLYAGSNNVTLNAQQLSEINSQLILAKAQRSEAEARARLIQKMLDDGGDIDATPEVLKSELIGRLIEQRVEVQRELAQLSATLLPSHPRIKQLNSELADVREQIRDEAAKIVKGLNNEAEVASARETSLRNSLNDTKAQASGQGDAEIKLRALEREAKANRDLLESYLARYRDASSRHDMGAVPAQAAIVSRAHASILPSFPKRGPLSLLVMAATALLALSYVVARELIGAPAEGREARRPSEPELEPRRAPVTQPVAPAAAAQARPTRAPAAPTKPRREPAVAQPPTMASPAKEPSPALAASLASSEGSQLEMKTMTWGPKNPPAGEQSAAAGLLDRLRQGLSAGRTEPEKEETAINPGLLARLRRALPSTVDTAEQVKAAHTVSAPEEAGSPLRPNDLRHYLNQRIASAARVRVDELADKVALAAPKVGKGKIGPALKSLDGVLNHILASTKGGAPRAVLVAGVTPKVDATQEAIRIARSLVARGEQVVLVDLTRGASAVSGPLGLPRAPGLTDLAAGRASFDDVIRIDADTPLQVITAGNPAVRGTGEELDRFMRVFEALTQAYDCVVLHADGDSVRRLAPALKFELPVVVVVLPQGVSPESEADELSDFAALGCQVVVYEKTAKDGRAGLLGRVAAV
ncbi:MAG: Wzz/FepE/Etk N-terminal domain-containing protein [Methyloceanibacter sp.]